MNDDPVKHKCTNCHLEAAGSFCQHCGQAQKPFERSTIKLIISTFAFLMSWDGNFFRSVGTLIRKPGIYARDWIEGRQARHVHPIRLVFLSTLAVLILSLTDATLISIKGHGVLKVNDMGELILVDCVVEDHECARFKKEKNDFEIKPFSLATSGDQKASLQIIPTDTDLTEAGLETEDLEVLNSMVSAFQLLTNQMNEDPHLFSSLMTSSMKRIFIFSTPVLALIYWIAFWGRDRTLAESGILSITSHIVLILLTAIGLFLTWISRGYIGGDLLLAVLLIIAIWHVFKAAQNFYGCGVVSGLLRASLVAILYSMFLGAALFFGFVIYLINHGLVP